MMYRCATWPVCCSITIVALGSQCALADDRLGDSLDQDRAYSARRGGQVPPLDTIMRKARSKGKVLDVQLKDGRYVLKILDADGRIGFFDSAALGSSKGPG